MMLLGRSLLEKPQKVEDHAPGRMLVRQLAAGSQYGGECDVSKPVNLFLPDPLESMPEGCSYCGGVRSEGASGH